MTLWEYRIEYPTLGGSDSDTSVPLMTDAWLDRLGASGWELVAIAPNSSNADSLTLVFKRPKS